MESLIVWGSAFLVLVNTALLLVLLAVVRLQAGKLTKATRDIVDRRINRELWPQIEHLIALYRVVDDQPALPSTRRWAASPDFLRRLAEHIREQRPAIIVECGSGTSTALMARICCNTGRGHIYALENHEGILDRTRKQLLREGLCDYVTMIHAPLSEHHYDGFETVFNWYELNGSSLPDGIDMLVIDGPPGAVNKYARYPAGPELFPRLSRRAHVFLDDASRPDEMALKKFWRELYPDLGVREHDTEKGCFEMFFLDHAVEELLGPAVRTDRSGRSVADASPRTPSSGCTDTRAAPATSAE